ncbi:hypothetical protein D9619_009423 [Psilocybe cf. subviscida]|uniref:F-box domain-containing protein n=1 Tax=Psilocybe cf. subviscida TaxID=2480587 RepID=A0A8H5FAB5_9AGAR|nr:hypothetical protein D9619_009423 [Psilocybe cf. subviscida]
MHAVLKTKDILREIFRHLRPDVLDSDKNDAATPYHAALACKQFLPHALDALWFSMDTLLPLLALIPNSSMMSSDDNALVLNGVLCKEDLEVFDTYARRVHEYIRLLKRGANGIRACVMMDLLDCLGRRCLLPNLRVLRINPQKRELSNSYCFFLSPTLEHLQIQTSPSSEFSFFLPHLVRSAPSLRHLEIYHPTIPANLLHLIARIPKLQTLGTSNNFVICPDTFSTLFPFAEHLNSWTADTVVFRPSTQNSAYLYPPRFSALRELELKEPVDADEILTLFSRGLFPKLDILSLFVPAYDRRHGNPAQYKASWSKVCSIILGDRYKLRTLHLQGDFTSRQITDESKMPLEDLFASTTAHGLVGLSIVMPKLLKCLTPTSIDHLCTRFPSLADLYINVDEPDFISFDALTVLARRLPLLSTLDIGIDGSVLTDPPTVPILSHRLSELSLDKAVIDDPFLFAHYIDRLFPFCTIEESDLELADE